MWSLYYNLLKRGVRIALRSKVNDSLITGLRIVDSILPVGRGQRQLINNIEVVELITVTIVLKELWLVFRIAALDFMNLGYMDFRF